MNVLVLGLGSVLMGDDALGPWAVRLLEAGYEMPPEVTVVDLGTPGPELAHYVAGLDALVVIDAVRHGGHAPGTVVALSDDAIRRPGGAGLALPPPRLSPHDPNLRDALQASELLPGGPPKRVAMFGIIPERVELGTGLTPAVAGALPRLVQAVVDELCLLGSPPFPRAVPATPDVWWERAAV